MISTSLLPPVPEPERPKDEKPALLPPVNPLKVAEYTGVNEPEPILVPFSPEKPSIPGAPPAAVEQPTKGETCSGEGKVAHMSTLRFWEILRNQNKKGDKYERL
ncbi:MAG: hypothetical protein COW04_05440 [Deltaproteobacteria bacterium CG12_big_fil_rev_8_21_14_0_65_43_10]|nr:MAG: hypothetical protein AUK23_11040 [Deltaproteobacteria bacterium CG2_30_43_15]PIQ45845.1 MAG: hypothetical protein COW04_05440 [Deltaproteobacteria bacterium CG12_big_fil_rev_8_21_14_0_65_43_10]PIU85861.1 MAG: hypothetical protein COS67_05635 [Deltaproteobacteria bacterium CG06_land_8_20_14_3_00_44_19]PIX25194.1 MAG: hypothetical protein COZ68_04500 [Deltaproteobacteria bacterium CG_4_8_14_3_um_filter_43_13]PJB44238.1 MAG: hypothetical protein CO106_03460 [Deltaproteobacteria bacterium C